MLPINLITIYFLLPSLLRTALRFISITLLELKYCDLVNLELRAVGSLIDIWCNYLHDTPAHRLRACLLHVYIT